MVLPYKCISIIKNKGIFYTITVLCLIFGMYKYYFYNDLDYQLNKFKNGSSHEKTDALVFFATKKSIKIIPDLIKYVDSDELIIDGKVPAEMSCAVTYTLEQITGLSKGNTCKYEFIKNEEKKIYRKNGKIGIRANILNG